MREGRLSRRVGEGRAAVSPTPSSPWLLLPHAYSSPSAVSTRQCCEPHASCATRTPATVWNPGCSHVCNPAVGVGVVGPVSSRQCSYIITMHVLYPHLRAWAAASAAARCLRRGRGHGRSHPSSRPRALAVRAAGSRTRPPPRCAPAWQRAAAPPSAAPPPRPTPRRAPGARRMASPGRRPGSRRRTSAAGRPDRGRACATRPPRAWQVARARAARRTAAHASLPHRA
eukprot:scaffold94452_cov75-Phaeocystis_antarctica.AAC.4